jgi:integrase/recombinase XerD
MARRIATLRSLLSWGHRVGYLPLNLGAVIRPMKVPNGLAERILEPDEVLRLLAAAGEAPRQGKRDHLFIRLAYVSGARVDELVGLDFEHVHGASEGGATLTLHGKGTKTRHVWITQGTFDELVAFAAPGGPVFRTRFKTRLSVRDAERLIERAAKRAKLRHCSPHWLRHAHATHALERGAAIHDVQANLGHESLSTTTRYVHARPSSGSARFLGL